MFDLIENNTGHSENSEFLSINTKKIVNREKNILTNSPTLLSCMSHELRTHMNAIAAFSFLMKENCSNNAECDDFSNLNDLFLEFRATLDSDDRNRIELITELPFLSSMEISFDRNRIFRVIRSLFNNSLRNTNTGYIKVGYDFVENRLNFYIIDSGQDYEKCKEFLYTEDLNKSLEQYNDPYTAINITLAKKIIKLLDGIIRIESNGVSGSCIYFSVPAKILLTHNSTDNKFAKSMYTI